MNAVQATQVLGIAGASAERFLVENTIRVIHDLKQHGFHVVDMKPEHTVLRTRSDGSLLRQRNGNPAYALVDYELLERLI